MKKAIFAMALLLLLSASTQADLVALYHLDGNAADSSGNGNDGTEYGDATYTTGGKFGDALSLDGNGDYVVLPASNSILNTDTFTVEAWFRTTLNHPVYGGTEGRLVNLHRMDSGPSTAVSLYVEKDKIGLLYYTGTSPPHIWVKHPVYYHDGDWHHIAVTYDATTYTLYYDGGVVASENNPFGGFGSYSAYLGTYNGSERFFNGDLDEVRIWDEALTDIPSILKVDIDIKPGSYPNSINPKAGGLIPVAILSTDDFDASTVKPETVALEGAGARGKGKSGNYGSLEDVDGDGDLDLVVQVKNEITWAENATEATLTGQTNDGIQIQGTDSVNIVPPE